ncbi:hypothetical protein NDU88_004905 [Pleurodeles waltl]|uniref:Uncharacterized protein n=1 Tax=Pleurodeles waltl TaxID=8319 RepID=A0AAV7UGH9_PLEWA|nr:hypothetical protein NDU88_004905 [Pleurodeles waltl]
MDLDGDLRDCGSLLNLLHFCGLLELPGVLDGIRKSIGVRDVDIARCLGIEFGAVNISCGLGLVDGETSNGAVSCFDNGQTGTLDADCPCLDGDFSDVGLDGGWTVDPDVDREQIEIIPIWLLLQQGFFLVRPARFMTGPSDDPAPTGHKQETECTQRQLTPG